MSDARFPPVAVPGADEDTLLSDQAISQADNHDSPWKLALEAFFPQAIQLFAPDLYAVIDWSVAPVFLDKELQSMDLSEGTPDKGSLRADKLVQVRHRSGCNARILTHVEIQGGAMGPKGRSRIARRVYDYRTFIAHRHDAHSHQSGEPPPLLFSLAILVRSRKGPDHLEYRREFLGQGVRFSFAVVHLSQWLDRWDDLESLARTNPFAVVIMAQLQAVRHRNHRKRLNPALTLARMLYDYGYPPEQIGVLLRLIEWMLRLPKDLEPAYLNTVQSLKQEGTMGYMMIAERQGMAKGLVKGEAMGLTKGQAKLLLGMVQRRFGPVDEAITQRIQSADSAHLETWSLNILDAATLDEVFRD